MNKLFFIIISLLLINNTFAQEESDDYYNVALKLIKKDKNFLAASKVCQKGLKESEDDADLSILLGKCYLELGCYTEGRYILKSVLDKDKTNNDARIYLLNLEHKTKRYSSAICYVNELLESKQYDKDLWIKKVNIYNDMGNILESQRSAKRLFQIFPEDPQVQSLYRGLTLEQSKKAKKEGNLALENSLNNDLIQRNIADKSTYLSVVDQYIKQGNYETALSMADAGLIKFKNNIDLSFKKIKILELQKNYDQAIQFTTELKKTTHNAALNKKLENIMEASASYYEKRDPYSIHKKLYDLNQNQASFDYLLKTSFSKGFYTDAGFYINEGLKKSPNSKAYLLKKYELSNLNNNTIERRKTIFSLYKLYPSDAGITALYQQENIKLAKEYLLQNDFDKAEAIFLSLQKTDAYFIEASENLVTIYENSNTEKAIEILNQLQKRRPNNNYLLKKTLLLSKNDNNELALKTAKNLKNNNQESDKYANLYNEQLSVYLKKTIEDEDYSKSIEIIDELLIIDPKNEAVYNNAIKVYSAIGDYPKAIEITKKAVENGQNKKEVNLKLADLYYKNNELENASTVLSDLNSSYPYNEKIKTSLIEVLTTKGNKQIAQKENQQAHQTFDKVLAINPKDSTAYIKKIALYIEEKNTDLAMETVNKALKFYPNKTKLFLDKGTVFEMRKQYDSAFVYQSKHKPSLYYKKEYNDHLDFLKSKTYKNFAAINYVKTSTDSISYDRSFVNLEYTHFGIKNNFSAKMYFAARRAGKGFQEEVQWVHFLNKTYSIQTTATIGQKYFSPYTGNVTVFRNFKNDYEGELGVGYFKLIDGQDVYQINAGVSKTFENYWISLRLRTLMNQNFAYNNLVFNSRMYTTPQKDYLSITISHGNAPVDQEIDNPNDPLYQFESSMLGIGYKKNIQHNTAIELNGSWFNYNVHQNSFINQYNISLTVSTRF